ncbi:DUF6452 family protein [Polaribacter sp. MSW13]|uniref:DUF6452 family protein n=1 Tax=Polaribacter marinus TaxID=2916838 RepID=A0A9X2AI86_9FLAO|nr:DUF6452 family protein [Polaribacter marinus]MCI2228326.1 DUF6452 family protein [Polaribacter marinus]
MKKQILNLLVLITIVSACEKDDFCTQNPVTPNLVLRFYDNTDRTTLKEVERFSIIAQGNTDSLYTNQTTDSIAIPLNSLTTETIYTLKMNNIDGVTTNNQVATFTIQYTTEEEYISRSCGFRVIFNNVSFSSNSSWIQDFTPNTLTTINNQNAAHVQIFH